jgi:hypothetical protein
VNFSEGQNISLSDIKVLLYIHFRSNFSRYPFHSYHPKKRRRNISKSLKLIGMSSNSKAPDLCPSKISRFPPLAFFGNLLVFPFKTLNLSNIKANAHNFSPHLLSTNDPKIYVFFFALFISIFAFVILYAFSIYFPLLFSLANGRKTRRRQKKNNITLFFSLFLIISHYRLRGSIA